jgi:hypothetical protein
VKKIITIMAIFVVGLFGFVSAQDYVLDCEAQEPNISFSVTFTENVDTWRAYTAYLDSVSAEIDDLSTRFIFSCHPVVKEKIEIAQLIKDYLLKSANAQENKRYKILISGEAASLEYRILELWIYYYQSFPQPSPIPQELNPRYFLL